MLSVDLLSDSPCFNDVNLTQGACSIQIGRSRSVDYRIQHPQISGSQCTIEWNSLATEALLTDTSSNGTFVNGILVGRDNQVTLPSGACITFLVATAEERDSEYGEEVPAFRVIHRTVCEEPKPDAAALARRHRLDAATREAKAAPAKSRAEEIAACKSEAVHGRQLRKRPMSRADVGGSSAKCGRTAAPPRECMLLAMSGDTVAHILGCLDTRSMISASSTCMRLRAESVHVQRISLRTLRTPLSLERAASLFGRFATLNALRLDGCCLAHDGAAALVSALLPGLDTLEMPHNCLTSVGADALATALSRCSAEENQLTSLDLTDTRLCRATTRGTHAYEEAPAAALLRALPMLTSLRLAHNEMRHTLAVTLCEGLLLSATSRLEVLDLSNNALGDDGVCAIAAQLNMARTALTRLNLANNFAGCAAAKKLAPMLKTNESLTELSLAGNAIRYPGGQKLAEALEVNRGLRSIDLSYNTFLLRVTHDHSTQDMQIFRKLRLPLRDGLTVLLYT